MSIFGIQKYIPQKMKICTNLPISENVLKLSYVRKIQIGYQNTCCIQDRLFLGLQME